jgi:hypothetical protein
MDEKQAEKKAAEEAAKPKLVITPSPEVVAAVKANPGSLRVWAKETEEAVPVTDRPRQMEVIEVLEVRDARPSLVQRFDCATGQSWLEEWQDGYGPKSSVEHAYDPIAVGLGRTDHD